MLIDLPTTGSESLSPIGERLPSGTSRHIIADGVKGTAQTIEMMQKLVNSGKRNNDIRELCGKILNPKDGIPCKSKDYFEYAKRLYEWVRDNILYAYDPHMVEYIEKPSVILKNRIADCDSMDILLCAMFEHVGLQSQFVTIKADPQRNDEYTHVYTRVMIPRVGWVCADPIMPKKWFGWEPPYPDGKRYWHAATDSLSLPLDTSPSVKIDRPGGYPQVMNFSDVTGMSGLGYVPKNRIASRMNSGVPVPSQIDVVDGREVNPQEMESPMMEESFGLGGMDGLFDTVSDAAKKALGIPPSDVTQEIARSVLGKIADGTEARKLNDARARVNARIDLANRTIASARAMSDSASNKNAIISKATSLRNAAYEENYAINDAMGKYNELAAFINNLPLVGPGAVPSLRGLGAVPWAAIGGVVASVAVLWLIHEYLSYLNKVSEKDLIAAQLEKDTLEAAKSSNLLPQYLASKGGKAIATGSPPVEDKGVCSLTNLPQCVKDLSTALFPIALTAAGLFIAYRVFDVGVVERLKPKSSV